MLRCPTLSGLSGHRIEVMRVIAAGGAGAQWGYQVPPLSPSADGSGRALIVNYPQTTLCVYLFGLS